MAARVHVPEEGISFVEAGGLRFGYLAWGEGPLVLLFHGFPDTARAWARIGPAIAGAGFRVVAPFLRGYAPTAIGERDPDTELLGRDVLALVDALGGGRARLVGHDWGAEAVYAAAALAPEKIERLVAIAIPHRGALPFTPRTLWVGRHFATLRFPGAEARFARDDYAMIEVLCRRWSPTWQLGPEELEPVKNAFAAPGCLRAALGYYRAVGYRTPAFLAAPLQVPTMCIGGADDPALSEAHFAGTAAHCAAGFTLRMIPGGHFCHRESETAFLDAAIPFLRG